MSMEKKNCKACIFYRITESYNMVNSKLISCDEKVPYKFMNPKKCKHFKSK